MKIEILLFVLPILTLIILGVVATTLVYVIRIFNRGDAVQTSQIQLIKQISDRHEHMISLLTSLTDEVLRIRQERISASK